jgi:cobalt-zinc-cadmium resistance protein CzcA
MTIPILVLLITSQISFSQALTDLTIEQAVNTALENNVLIKTSILNENAQQSLIKTAFDLSKTNLSLTYGQANTIFKDNNFVINQNFTAIATGAAQKKYLSAQANLAVQQTAVNKNELKYQVQQVYYQLLYYQHKASLLMHQDSIYSNFVRAGELRYKTGESNLLEKTTANSQLSETKNLIQQNEADIQITTSKLQLLLNTNAPIQLYKLSKMKIDSPSIEDTIMVNKNPMVDYFQKSILVSNTFTKTEKTKLIPELSIGYFNQSLQGIQNVNGKEKYFDIYDRFQGINIGIAVPIWAASINAKIEAAKINEKIANQNLVYCQAQLNNEYSMAVKEYKKCTLSLDYYEKTALIQAEQILVNAQKSFKGGVIDYIEYTNALNKVLTIKNNHLNQLLNHNLAVIKLAYITGQ